MLSNCNIQKLIPYVFPAPSVPLNSQATPLHSVCVAQDKTPLIRHVHCTRAPAEAKVCFPTARGSLGHCLFISTFMLVSKVICDDTYSNKSWSIVTQGIFQLRKINQMKREICQYLKWELNVDPITLWEFEVICKGFVGLSPYILPSTKKTTPPLGNSTGIPPGIRSCTCTCSYLQWVYPWGIVLSGARRRGWWVWWQWRQWHCCAGATVSLLPPLLCCPACRDEGESEGTWAQRRWQQQCCCTGATLLLSSIAMLLGIAVILLEVQGWRWGWGQGCMRMRVRARTRVTTTLSSLSSSLCCQMCEDEGESEDVLSDAWGWSTTNCQSICSTVEYRGAVIQSSFPTQTRLPTSLNLSIMYITPTTTIPETLLASHASSASPPTLPGIEVHIAEIILASSLPSFKVEVICLCFAHSVVVILYCSSH